MPFFVFDLVDTDRILEGHTIGAGEIQKSRARGGVSPRSKNDRDILPTEKIVRPQDIIIGRNLMIDMPNPRLGARRHG